MLKVAPSLSEAALFCRVLLGMVLVFAGLAKVFDPPATLARIVEAYQVVPKRAAAPLARGLPFAEISLGAMLVGDVFTRYAALVAGVLVFGFGLAIALNLMRGRRELRCGCFGSGGHSRLSWALVARNTLLVGLALLVALAPRDGIPRNSASVVLLAFAVLAGTAVASRLRFLLTSFRSFRGETSPPDPEVWTAHREGMSS
jgi:Methylamine utilisation protein MauE